MSNKMQSLRDILGIEVEDKTPVEPTSPITFEEANASKMSDTLEDSYKAKEWAKRAKMGRVEGHPLFGKGQEHLEETAEDIAKRAMSVKPDPEGVRDINLGRYRSLKSITPSLLKTTAGAVIADQLMPMMQPAAGSTEDIVDPETGKVIEYGSKDVYDKLVSGELGEDIADIEAKNKMKKAEEDQLDKIIRMKNLEQLLGK